MRHRETRLAREHGADSNKLDSKRCAALPPSEVSPYPPPGRAALLRAVAGDRSRELRHKGPARSRPGLSSRPAKPARTQHNETPQLPGKAGDELRCISGTDCWGHLRGRPVARERRTLRPGVAQAGCPHEQPVDYQLIWRAPLSSGESWQGP